MGHTKAVKDICFNNDGTKFLSAAYDRQIKLWDTETGKIPSCFDRSISLPLITFRSHTRSMYSGLFERKDSPLC
jgi:pre-mRNA-processing factor 17